MTGFDDTATKWTGWCGCNWTAGLMSTRSLEEVVGDSGQDSSMLQPLAIS